MRGTRVNRLVREQGPMHAADNLRVYRDQEASAGLAFHDNRGLQSERHWPDAGGF